MASYRVHIRGEGLLLIVDGQPGRFGFHVERFVTASDPDDAVRAALALVRSDPRLAKTEQPPQLAVESIERLGERAQLPKIQPGFAFYPEAPSEDGAA